MERNIIMERHTPVVITDIRIPFWSMVKFMVKWTFASIPAAIVVGGISLAVYLVFYFFFLAPAG